MTNFIKYKIYQLQKKYKNISDAIERFQSHIINLNNLRFLDDNYKIKILNQLFDINKNLNTKYNNCIGELNLAEINDESTTNIINIIKENEIDLPDIFNTINENIEDDELIIKSMDELEKNLQKQNINLFKSVPLQLSFEKIKILINNNGIDSIKFLINFNNIIVNEKVMEIINEIDRIAIPLSIIIDNTSKIDNNFKFIIPDNYEKNNNKIDLLERKRILIINDVNNNCYKIEILFKNDLLSLYVKTCQINYPYLYQKKNQIVSYVEDNLTECDMKFLKTFIRHDYLGNLYSYDVESYGNYFKKTYFRYVELINTSFINIMKEFISKNNSIKDLFDMIFLHLMGDEESNDVAVTLIGLLGEKKQFSGNLNKYIYDNLTYFLQVKVQKSQTNINDELKKIKDISVADIDYKKQLALNRNIPENVKAITLEKIEEMKSMNNDYFKQLMFVKYILNFPWSSPNDNLILNNLKNPNESRKYINNIKDKLENLSYGHDEAKKLLVQIIGKWISNPNSHGTSFGLVGPPGVGKTLLAKSISTALDIPFAQITLGGQNDGELLHGHGYTYSGSQPGLIIKKMVEMGKSRCILYFDELDKTCSKYGKSNEISSILIHLTDPNMNKSFQDRFFQGIEFPLDKVILIFSYNDSSLIDPILLDRLKEIHVEPYTLKDKLNICNNFIIPEIETNIGFNKNVVFWDDDILEYLITNYTNEAGVRSIKRKIEDIYMELNLHKLKKENYFKKNKKIKLTKEIIIEILKEPKMENQKIHSEPSIGIINGLYATTNGNGGITPIQIYKNHISNSFEIKLTGSQGKVMKESVNCSLTVAMNHIENNKEKYKDIVGENLADYIKQNFPQGFHIHAPSTSTPKDGPSAGCAFTSAFISRILNKPIRNDIAMTGEIELTGDITKIGGLTFKLLGAKNAGVKLAFVPKENEKDYEEIIKKNPKLIDDNFSIQLVSNIKDLIDTILL
jgi:endopeptidase La